MNEYLYPKTIDDLVKRWDDNESIFTISLGGIGPGYEQCIQNLLFEIVKGLREKKYNPDNDKDFEQYKIDADVIVSRLDKEFHFSGAQVGAAKQMAWQFLAYGYREMMTKCPGDRLIQVRKRFK